MSQTLSEAATASLAVPATGRAAEVFSPGALAFVGALARRFAPRIEAALAERVQRRERRSRGEPLDFLPHTRQIREERWRIAQVPPELEKRVVEITGPVDRKMIINALNSGADVFMADFEDATSPTWENMVQGQVNLSDAVRREITYQDPESGKQYRLNDKLATLFVRPRGLHLVERHVLVDGRPLPGCLVDFGVYAFNNARALIDHGTGPYFYLPKMEAHEEARIWNEIFFVAEDSLGLPSGSIKATCLIETLPAAFEMDEILWELREHSAGLNCGRWDYIFSFIKTRREDPRAVLPDRSQVAMTQPCMRAYTQLAIKTCHRRGAHAMGGMSAFIPVKGDADANASALERVREDKLREVTDGHDGTWVAHPALVAVAREAFEPHLRGPNQVDRERPDVDVSAEHLLEVPTGVRTEAGLRHNIRVGVQYLESWLRGVGAVPLYNLMEDAATAEISRAQLWQWLRWGATLDDGREITHSLVDRAIDEEMDVVAAEVGPDRMRTGRFDDARELFTRVATAEPLEEFLTLPGYEILER